MRQAASSWLQMPDISFFYTGIQAWMPWCDKFLDVAVVNIWMSGV